MGFMMEEHNQKHFEESKPRRRGVHLVDSVYLDVACLETEIGRFAYIVDCMEPKLEELRLHVFNLECAMLEILNGDCIEEIVSEVVGIVSLKANKTNNLLSRTIVTTFVEGMDEDLLGEMVNVREMVADCLSQRGGDAVDGMCSTGVGEAPVVA